MPLPRLPATAFGKEVGDSSVSYRTWQEDTKPKGLQAGSSKKGPLQKEFVYRQPSRWRWHSAVTSKFRKKSEYFKGPIALTILLQNFEKLFGGGQAKDMTTLLKSLQCLHYMT